MTRKQERTILFLLAAIQFIHIVDFMIIMPLGERLQELFDFGPGQFAVLVSSYTLSAGTGSLISALFIDRFDRKQALAGAFLGLIIGTVATSFAGSFEQLVVMRVLTGAFGGIIGGLVLSIIGDVVPNERRAGAMGMVMAAFSAAAVVGVPIGLALANWKGWKMPFLALGGVGLAVLVVVLLRVPAIRVHLETGVTRPNPFASFKLAFTRANQLKALGLVFFLVLGQFTVIPFIAPYLEANVGFSKNGVVWVYFLGGLATAIGAPVIGQLADKFGRVRVYSVSLVLSLIPLMVITTMTPIKVWWSVSFGGVAFVYLITTAFFIFISGRMIPATTMITSSVPAAERGSFMSINSALREYAGAIGTLIAGAILTKENGLYQHYEIVGYLAIAFSLVALVIGQRIKVMDEEKTAEKTK